MEKTNRKKKHARTRSIKKGEKSDISQESPNKEDTTSPRPNTHRTKSKRNRERDSGKDVEQKISSSRDSSKDSSKDDSRTPPKDEQQQQQQRVSSPTNASPSEKRKEKEPPGLQHSPDIPTDFPPISSPPPSSPPPPPSPRSPPTTHQPTQSPRSPRVSPRGSPRSPPASKSSQSSPRSPRSPRAFIRANSRSKSCRSFSAAVEEEDSKGQPKAVPEKKSSPQKAWAKQNPRNRSFGRNDSLIGTKLIDGMSKLQERKRAENEAEGKPGTTSPNQSDEGPVKAKLNLRTKKVPPQSPPTSTEPSPNLARKTNITGVNLKKGNLTIHIPSTTTTGPTRSPTISNFASSPSPTPSPSPSIIPNPSSQPQPTTTSQSPRQIGGMTPSSTASSPHLVVQRGGFLRLKGDSGKGTTNVAGEGDGQGVSSPPPMRPTSPPTANLPSSPTLSSVQLEGSSFCTSTPDSPSSPMDVEGRKRNLSLSSTRSPVVSPAKKSGLPHAGVVTPVVSSTPASFGPQTLSPNSSAYHSSPSIIAPIRKGTLDSNRKSGDSGPAPSFNPPPSSTPPPLPSSLVGSGGLSVERGDRAKLGCTSPGVRGRRSHKSIVIRPRGGDADPKDRERERVVALFKRKLHQNIPEFSQEERTKTEEVHLSYTRNIAPLLHGGFVKAKNSKKESNSKSMQHYLTTALVHSVESFVSDVISALYEEEGKDNEREDQEARIRWGEVFYRVCLGMGEPLAVADDLRALFIRFLSLCSNEGTGEEGEGEGEEGDRVRESKMWVVREVELGESYLRTHILDVANSVLGLAPTSEVITQAKTQEKKRAKAGEGEGLVTFEDLVKYLQRWEGEADGRGVLEQVKEVNARLRAGFVQLGGLVLVKIGEEEESRSVIKGREGSRVNKTRKDKGGAGENEGKSGTDTNAEEESGRGDGESEEESGSVLKARPRTRSRAHTVSCERVGICRSPADDDEKHSLSPRNETDSNSNSEPTPGANDSKSSDNGNENENTGKSDDPVGGNQTDDDNNDHDDAQNEADEDNNNENNQNGTNSNEDVDKTNNNEKETDVSGDDGDGGDKLDNPSVTTTTQDKGSQSAILTDITTPPQNNQLEDLLKDDDSPVLNNYSYGRVVGFDRQNATVALDGFENNLVRVPLSSLLPFPNSLQGLFGGEGAGKVDYHRLVFDQTQDLYMSVPKKARRDFVELLGKGNEGRVRALVRSVKLRELIDGGGGGPLEKNEEQLVEIGLLPEIESLLEIIRVEEGGEEGGEKKKRAIRSLVEDSLLEMQERWVESVDFSRFSRLFVTESANLLKNYVDQGPVIVDQQLGYIKWSLNTMRERIDERMERLKSGQKKDEVCNWWLTHIDTKVRLFLGLIGYKLDLESPDFLDFRPPPQEEAGILKNLSLISQILNPKDTDIGGQARFFVSGVKNEVYRVIDEFLEEVRQLFWVVFERPLGELKVEEVRDLVEGGKGGEWAVGLLNDVQHILEMKEMDVRIENEREAVKGGESLEMSRVVPIAGIILSHFHMKEVELLNIKETWCLGEGGGAGGREEGVGGEKEKKKKRKGRKNV